MTKVPSLLCGINSCIQKYFNTTCTRVTAGFILKIAKVSVVDFFTCSKQQKKRKHSQTRNMESSYFVKLVSRVSTVYLKVCF